MTQLALVQIAEDIAAGYRPNHGVLKSVESAVHGIREVMEDAPEQVDRSRIDLLAGLTAALTAVVAAARETSPSRPRRKFQKVQAGEFPSLGDACAALGLIPPAADIKPDTVVRLRARDSGRPCGRAYAYPSGNGGVVIDYDTNQTALFLSQRTLGNLTKGVDHGNV